MAVLVVHETAFVPPWLLFACLFIPFVVQSALSLPATFSISLPFNLAVIGKRCSRFTLEACVCNLSVYGTVVSLDCRNSSATNTVFMHSSPTLISAIVKDLQLHKFSCDINLPGAPDDPHPLNAVCILSSSSKHSKHIFI